MESSDKQDFGDSGDLKSMSGVKWIKIVVDIFDDEKVKLIEELPNGDAVIVIWFKLLCLAGRCNRGGMLMLTDIIPYTDEMLAVIFRKKASEVRQALQVFEEFGMIEIVNDAITIPKWGEYQSEDKLAEKRAQNAERQRIYREKLLEQHDAPEGKAERQNKYQWLIDAWNNTMPSNIPRLRSIDSNRKKKTDSRIEAYGRDTILEAISIAEKSDFLMGRKEKFMRSFSFDWFIGPENFKKVLEGNYNNRDYRPAIGTQIQGASIWQ